MRIVALKEMNWFGRSNHSQIASDGRSAHGDARGGYDRQRASGLIPGAELIPGYRLINKIGRGGFGEVWAASKGDERVAIKVFHGNLDTPEAVDRATMELEGLNRIKNIAHPGILKIHSYAVKSDRLILITDLARFTLGELFTRLRPRFPAIRRHAYAVHLLQSVAQTLDYLQTKHDLLHLDIKPANLLLVGNDCKVADFGTVFRLRPRQPGDSEMPLFHSTSGNPNGIDLVVKYRTIMDIPWKEAFRRDASLCTFNGLCTPYYAPPEAHERKSSRSFDQYSLAITYCELVAGKIPFKNELQFTARMQGQLDLSFLPDQLRGVFRRALRPNPEDRYPSCLAFMTALQLALEPLIEKDKRNNNWDRWLSEMETVSNTTMSPKPHPNATRIDLIVAAKTAGRMLFHRLCGLVPFGLRSVAIAAAWAESRVWGFIPRRWNSTASAIAHTAAIVVTCSSIGAIHKTWFGQISSGLESQKLDAKDQQGEGNRRGEPVLFNLGDNFRGLPRRR